MKKHARFKKQRGFILISTYLIVALVSLFSLVYFARSNAYLQTSERNRNKIIAFNMAEAAADFALTQLSDNAAYTSDGSTYVSMDRMMTLSNGTPFASVRGGYTVRVETTAQYNQRHLTNPSLYPGFASIPENPNVRVIEASGFAPDNNNTSRAYQAVPVITYGRFDPVNLFDFAIFAENSIELTDNDKVSSVDSYDSRNGNYGGANKSGDADIAVNSTAAGAIALNGTTLVQGDVYVGAGGDPSTGISIGNKAAIDGTSSTLSENIDYPTPSTNLPSEGAKEVHGGDGYLPAGTYHFSSLSITSSLTITGSGPTTIFVDGSVDIAGLGIITQNSKPPDLIIYVIGSQDVKVAGNGGFYGGIYAPKSEVQNTGNGGIFGCVVAKVYDQNSNSSIHFDKAMTEVQSDQSLGKINVTAWQEQNSLTWGT